MITFTEEIPHEIFYKLERDLNVVSSYGQYRINSEINLDTYDFKDQEKYRLFFKQFAEFANPLWKEKTSVEWDFSSFPFREPSDIIQGLYRIWKTGGAYSNGLSDSLTSKLEEKYRMAFQKESKSLIIFCTVQEDYLGEDVSGGWGVGDQFLALKEISSWFHLVAWDGLMFIINPEENRLYVIAYTDED
ncbi:MAG: hypothetical protein RTV31_00745 [Candidatus Thorarchaeota archaeon]